MNYYERALQLKEETIANRRYLHTNAEAGLDLPKTRAFVMQKLLEYGIEAKPCGHGITATVGKGGKCILLRADMDALPMTEESELEFACPTGTEAHCCGHDLHAAMLLTAAKMLKENEDQLEGTVKLMFQPAEETFQGARDMIENGLLENPVPDACLAYHVTVGRMPVGIYMYNNTGTMMFSVDGFKIDIRGKGAHGAYPHESIDPINIGAHIFLALQSLIAREVDPSKDNLMTIGQFNAGTAPNIIPESARLQGTIRSNDRASRERLVRRMKEVAVKTADTFGGVAKVDMLSEIPPMICDPGVTDEMISYMKELNYPGAYPYAGISASASDDFACVMDEIPGTFMYISAGFMDERGDAPAHNSRVMFNEDICPIGASCYAHCAAQWLKNNR